MNSTTRSPQPASSTASDSTTEASTTDESSSSTTTGAISETASPQEPRPDTPESDEDGHEGSDQPSDDTGADPASRARREAAKYRRRAQDAETARDAALAQITDYQKAIVQTALTQAAHGVTLDALTAAGHDTAGMFKGAALDADKLRAASAATAERFGIRVGVIPTQGTGETNPSADQRSKGWADAFVAASDG